LDYLGLGERIDKEKCFCNDSDIATSKHFNIGV